MPYVLAVMLTAGILSLHGAIGLASSDPPILDMFLIPVVVSAYLGGLIPGLFATLTATLVTDFFLPPAHTFVIDGLHNRLDWGAMVAIGVLISVLSGALRRSEQVRAKAREQLTRIAATLPGIIHAFHIRADGTACFPYANRKIEDIYGISPEELARDATIARELVHPADRPRMSATVEESRRTLTPWKQQFRVCHPQKGVVWVEAHSMPEREADGSTRWHGFMYDITDRKKTEAELEKAHQELVKTSRLAGMAEMATGVLHNVGNVLNNVNVATSILKDTARNSRVANLSKAVALIQEHSSDLAEFLNHDPKGRQVIPYLRELGTRLDAEHTELLKELAQLEANVEHIQTIVSIQQSCGSTSGQRESIQLAELVEETIRLNISSLSRYNIEVVRDLADVPAVVVDKPKVLQILINLIRNAQQACQESDNARKTMTVRLAQADSRLRISVSDNGVGIAPENLGRIFSRGFTTKKDGHGFGLHSSLAAAEEIGGSLTVQSDGPSKGACFTLELPTQRQPS
jgi:PAS domain S-box-containing protein